MTTVCREVPDVCPSGGGDRTLQDKLGMYSVLSIVIILTLYGLVPTHLTQPQTQYSVLCLYLVRTQ